MKVVIPGGSGHLGGLLVPALLARGDEVLVLGRGRSRDASGAGARHVAWDGVPQGPWAEELDGAVNVAAPHPLPHRDFARALRAAAGAPFGLPMPRWLVELGTVLLRTDSELVLKSRRVVPGRLVAAGFRFEFPEWPAAARDLVERVRTGATRAPPAA